MAEHINPKRAVLKKLGQTFFAEQLEAAGGVLAEDEVASRLSKSVEEILAMTEHKQLLAVPVGTSKAYPVWQFSHDGVVPLFRETMALLDTNEPISIVQFFLAYDDDLGKTPIQALKDERPKELEIVAILARQFLRQVAR